MRDYLCFLETVENLAIEFFVAWIVIGGIAAFILPG
jgi:hypothetical protein